MKCLSINLWNINSPFNERMDALKGFIKNVYPDVICFQEVSLMNGVPQIDFISEIAPYRYIYIKSGIWEKREEGLAIASLHPIINYDYIKLPTQYSVNDMQRILMWCDIIIDNKKVSIYNTHFAYHKDSIKCRELQMNKVLKTICNSHSNQDYIILCGDFNSFPTETIINGLTSNGVLYETRKDDTIFTFSSNNIYTSRELWPDRNLDYIFASENMNILSSICMCETDGYSICSDHFGILSEGGFIL